MAEEQKAGNLDTILALEEEKRSIVKTSTMSPDDAGIPEALMKLRAIYRAELAKVEAGRSARRKALIDPLVVRLKSLETELTRNGRIAEALEVRKYREELADDGKGTAAANVGEPAKIVQPAPVDSTPGKSSSATDRKAAEWVLGVGGEVTITIGARSILVNRAEDLPKTNFDLKIVNLPVCEATAQTAHHRFKAACRLGHPN